MPRVGAVLVAAGSSSRVGPGAPKQFQTLGARPMFVMALEPLLAVCEEIAVVVPAADKERAARLLSAYGIDVGPEGDGGKLRLVSGGKRRQDSVGAGLDALSEDIEVVLIHDAARPFATRELVERVVAAALEHGAAVPVVPVRDTVKRVDDGFVVASLDRSVLRLSQTPQGFRTDVLVSARAEVGDVDVTDDAQCVEAARGVVVVVEGDPGNVKITDASDLEAARLRLAAGTGLDPAARVGTGSDCHRMAPGRALVLCGVEVPFEKGLEGWSDADVATHALMDALLGAVAERDIGYHFPPGDKAYEGAKSTELLARVVQLLRSRGFGVGSVDLTITAEAPELSPFVDRMRAELAGVLGVGEDHVSVKATTTEGTGAEGRGDAISATAIAVVRSLSESGDRSARKGGPRTRSREGS